jgi:hypothetical protein
MFSPSIGYDLRYTAESSFLLPLAFGLAWAATPRARISTLAQRLPVLRPRVALPIVAAVTAAFVALGVRSGQHLADAWEGPALRDYVTNLQQGAQLEAQRGTVTVLEGEPPPGLVPPFVAPYNRYSNIVRLGVKGVGVDGPTGTPLVIDPDGTARPWRNDKTRKRAAGPLTGRLLTLAGPGATRNGREVCADTRNGPAPVDVDLEKISPLDGRLKMLQLDLRRVLVGAKVNVFFDRGSGFGGGPDRIIGFLPAQPRVRTAIPQDVKKLRIEVAAPGVACLRAIEITPYT